MIAPAVRGLQVNSERTRPTFGRHAALSLAVLMALGALAPSCAASGASALAPGGMSPESPVDGRRLSVRIERDELPADGQTPAKLRIELRGADGRLATGEAVATLEASAGRFQLPGASSDELGMEPRDLDNVMPGFQVSLVDGVADVWLRAPVEAQTVQIKVGIAGETASGEVHFLPELREMLATGLVEGVIAFDRKNPLKLSQARPQDGFEDRIDSWSRDSGDGKRHAAVRTAFFLKGKIKGDALLTLAYDSDKPGHDVLFRDIDPERWYPVYGDASTVGFEARSNSRLYVRLDKGRSYLMYGDIATGSGFSQRYGQGAVAQTQVRDLGQYNRSLTGLRGHLEGDRGVLNVFAADDNLRQVVEEFPGRGLSGPYTVSNSSHAVVGSERVELVIRDRYAPSRIVSTRALARFTDYTFEPFSGRILFTQPIPSVDADLNPVSARITYEIDQGGDAYWLYGADGQYALGEHVEVGGSYVRDRNPLAPFELGSVNATLRFGRDSWLRAEAARTTSTVNAIGGNIYTLDPFAASGEHVSGDAWRAEFGHRTDRFGMLAWYGRSDADFNNPASSYLGGRKQAGLNAEWLLGEGDSPAWGLYAKGTYIEDTRTGADREQAEAGVRYRAGEKLTLEAGAHHVSEHAGDGSALGNGLSIPGSLTAPYGVGVLTPGFGGGFFGGGANALDPGTGQTLYNTGAGWSSGYGSWVGNGLAGVPVAYSALRLGVRYQATDRFDVSAEAEQDLSHSEHRRASLGAGWRVHDRTRLYGRYEWNTGLSTVATRDGVTDPVSGNTIPSPYETNAFVFGLETDYMEGGTLFNEYRMYDAYSARQAQWASGIRNLWHVNRALSVQTSAERLQVLDGDGQQATAATVSAEWRPDELWLLSGRLEWRRADAIHAQSDANLPPANWLSNGYASWLSTLTAARKLNRDWTLLARNYYLVNDYDRNADGTERRNSYEDRFQVGVAYRDTDTNRSNVLARYEYWTRRDYSLTDWQDTQALAPSEGYDKHIASLHADWHPDRVWWLTGRLAGKRQTDYFGGESTRYTAYLAGGRATYDLSERWDVSLLGYRMWSPGGARQYAIGTEVGYLLTSNLWLSAGYNWRGFRDDDLTNGDYTNEGAFLRLRFKFDEDLFRGNDPATNRALPR